MSNTTSRFSGFRSRRIAIAASALVACALPALALAQEATLEGGAISVEQVEAGEGLYMENCSGCHGDDLRSTDANATDLRGPTFNASWDGVSLAEKHDFISTMMPPGQDGSLSDQQYLDVMTYILSVNGIAPSEEGGLSVDDTDLEAVTFNAP